VSLVYGTRACLPGFSGIRIQSVQAATSIHKSSQLVSHSFSVSKHVAALLIVDSRNTVEQIALQAKRDGGSWRMHDRVARFWYIYIQNCSLVDLPGRGFNTNSGDDPATLM
jgi:hypothetical protein